MKILITFTILSIVNVTFSTIRSLATVKSGKTAAALLNGGYFAFYNIVLIYSVADFPMWEKCLVTFICNVVGVFLVKLLEEKIQKEKLWKIEFTIDNKKVKEGILVELLNQANVSANYIKVGDYTIFNCYCENKEKSYQVKKIIQEFNARYFITESKNF